MSLTPPLLVFDGVERGAKHRYDSSLFWKRQRASNIKQTFISFWKIEAKRSVKKGDGRVEGKILYPTLRQGESYTIVSVRTIVNSRGKGTRHNDLSSAFRNTWFFT